MKFTTRIAAMATLVVLMIAAFAVPALAAEETPAPAPVAEPGFLDKLARPSVFIPLLVLLAAIIACVVIFFILPKRREKTIKFFRGLKSECKKVSWYTWKQTWKGTVVVAVISVVIAVVIGLLDYGFSSMINIIAGLF